jgi:hypothetical protein
MTKVAMNGPVADLKSGDSRVVSLLPEAAEKPAQLQGESHDSQLTGPEEAFSTLLCGRNRPPKSRHR